jgi:flavodoxin/formate hydrogenlyase subunit 6/NADH:ubiquinone oxidoreductase subunit I
MSTEIYYFSGTGNSLAVARDIAEKINGKLIPIYSVIEKENIETDADTIGIIFPVYHATLGQSGIPFMVRKFIKKLKNINSKYLFAICTHGGMPGATIGNLQKIIKLQGGDLSAGFAIKMGIPYLPSEKLAYVLSHKELKANNLQDNKRRQKLFSVWKIKLKTIGEGINHRKKIKLETSSMFAQLIGAPLLFISKKAARSRYMKLSGLSSASFDELTFNADRSFNLNEKCIGCGTCSKVCLAKNIKMVNNKPTWQHRCENCFACYQWCPQVAIYAELTEYEKRYHHPDVKVSDMIGQVKES